MDYKATIKMPVTAKIVGPFLHCSYNGMVLASIKYENCKRYVGNDTVNVDIFIVNSKEIRKECKSLDEGLKYLKSKKGIEFSKECIDKFKSVIMMKQLEK